MTKEEFLSGQQFTIGELRPGCHGLSYSFNTDDVVNWLRFHSPTEPTIIIRKVPITEITEHYAVIEAILSGKPISQKLHFRNMYKLQL